MENKTYEENKSQIGTYFQQTNAVLNQRNRSSRPLENAEYNDEEQRKEQLYDDINASKGENDFSNPIKKNLENDEEIYIQENFGNRGLVYVQEEEKFDKNQDFEENVGDLRRKKS